MTWTEFFDARIPHIYFVYGLAFFVLGLAVALEIGRAEPTRFSRAMRPLAVFGLTHGFHEWIEMFAIIGREAYGFQPNFSFDVLRLVILAISFASLIAFGVQMLRHLEHMRHPDLWIGLGVLLFYSLGVTMLGRWLAWQQPAWFAAADVLARYSMAIPGAVLATWALMVQRQVFLQSKQPAFANDLLWVAVAFCLYGIIGQFFVGPSPLFPSSIVNADSFKGWFGVPIQLFRGTMAGIIAVFTIRALRSFEVNRQQALVAARRQVEEEISHRDALRQEFLQRIVETQEEERTRIARELHDELGQALTGLSVGLRGVQSSLDKPDLLQQQLSQLEEMALQALGDMRHMITELRPALLDDIGLPAALRHYVDNFTNLTNVEITLTMDTNHTRLPGNIETILFRITQEALTNIARHAQATQASIDLRCADNRMILQIKDDGLGFDPTSISEKRTHASWGLLGIQERVKLANGEVQIQSEIGAGTTLLIQIPLK